LSQKGRGLNTPNPDDQIPIYPKSCKVFHKIIRFETIACHGKEIDIYFQRSSNVESFPSVAQKKDSVCPTNIIEMLPNCQFDRECVLTTFLSIHWFFGWQIRYKWTS